jgi:hypothetical protein
MSLSGNWPCTLAIIHGLSGEPSDQWLWPTLTVSVESSVDTWQHRTIWCAGQPKDAMTNSTVSVAGVESNRALFTVRCAPDSPVHPWTEGNQGLPNKEETTHVALRAIKVHHIRMELLPKHTKSTLKLRFKATTLSTHSREN